MDENDRKYIVNCAMAQVVVGDCKQVLESISENEGEEYTKAFVRRYGGTIDILAENAEEILQDTLKWGTKDWGL